MAGIRAGKTMVATGKLQNYTRVCATNSLADIQTRLLELGAIDVDAIAAEMKRIFGRNTQGEISFTVKGE